MSFAQLKASADRYQRNILLKAGVPEQIFNGKAQPCPICGGTDRFQFSESKRFFYCRGCGNCDWIELLGRLLGGKNKACRYIEDYLGGQRITSDEAKQRVNEWEQQRLAEEKAKHEAAKAKAKAQWGRAASVAHHPYLERKQISAPALRQLGTDLLVPVYSAERELVNLQRIAPDGVKLFIKGGRVSGCFCVIGNLKTATKAFICEGYATGKSLFDCYGFPVICVFMVANLLPSSQAIKRLYPKLELVFCADNDLHVQTGNMVNPGVYYARRAANEVGGKVLIPASHRKMDFNDLMCQGSGNLIYKKVGNDMVVTRQSYLENVNVNFSELLHE